MNDNLYYCDYIPDAVEDIYEKFLENKPETKKKLNEAKVRGLNPQDPHLVYYYALTNDPEAFLNSLETLLEEIIKGESIWEYIEENYGGYHLENTLYETLENNTGLEELDGALHMVSEISKKDFQLLKVSSSHVYDKERFVKSLYEELCMAPGKWHQNAAILSTM